MYLYLFYILILRNMTQNVFIENRKVPLCDVPPMTTGNRPADGGHLIIEADDYDAFLKKEPSAKKYIKKLVGSAEFINNKKRHKHKNKK